MIYAIDIVIGGEQMKKESEGGLKKLPSFYKEVMGSAPFLQFNSNKEVTLDGCRGILEYQQEVIRVNTGKMVIAFKGRNLNIKCLNASSIVIGGYITNVEFIR